MVHLTVPLSSPIAALVNLEQSFFHDLDTFLKRRPSVLQNVPQFGFS